MDENTTSQEAANYVELTSGIVASFVASNSVQRESVPDLIATVYAALRSLGTPAPEPEVERPTPPVSVKKSITPDYLISMEDGRQYKSLKRHLSGRGLTPNQYREKWGLGRDYPMVAPNYSAQRSELAKSLGLGRKPTTPAEPDEASAAEPEAISASDAPTKRGRKSAAQDEVAAPAKRRRKKAA